MGCTEGARTFLVVFNFIFWLSGAAILGVGVWLSIDQDVQTYIDVIHIDTSDPYFKFSAYIMVGFGTFIFLVGFLGCCGALRRNQALLGMYIFCLVLVMAGELAAGILTAVYKNEIEADLKSHMMIEVQEKYSSPQYASLTKALDAVQSGMNCCGVNGPSDYEDSFWKNNTAGPTDNVPLTCCVLSSASNEDPVAKDLAACQAEVYLPGLGDAIYKKGCYNSVLEWFRKHSVVVIGVGCGIAGLELFGLLFALCMCCETRKEDQYD